MSVERLTEKHYKASDGYYMKCSETCTFDSRKNCGHCEELDKLVDLLGSYEQTGLTPREIISLKINMAIINAMFENLEVERMRELAEADRDGRCVVLPYKEAVAGRCLEQAVRQVREYGGCNCCKNCPTESPEDCTNVCEECGLDCGCRGCYRGSKWEWDGGAG